MYNFHIYNVFDLIYSIFSLTWIVLWSLWLKHPESKHSFNSFDEINNHIQLRLQWYKIFLCNRECLLKNPFRVKLAIHTVFAQFYFILFKLRINRGKKCFLIQNLYQIDLITTNNVCWVCTSTSCWFLWTTTRLHITIWIEGMNFSHKIDWTNSL